MDEDKRKMLREFLSADEAGQAPCVPCEERAMRQGELPALAALESELAGDAAGDLLSAEELDDATLDLEIAIESDRLAQSGTLTGELETVEEPLSGEEELAFAELADEAGDLDALVALARKYPGLRITFSF